MRAGALLLALLSLAACSSTRTIPSNGSVIPDWSMQVAPNFNVGLDKIIYWGSYAAVAYVVLDPLKPNWRIEEAKLSDEHYHLSLHMKRYYAGGAGEARMVFVDRAKEIARAKGAENYEVLEYTEGMESSVLGSQRVANGVIHLIPKPRPSLRKAEPEDGQT